MVHKARRAWTVNPEKLELKARWGQTAHKAFPAKAAQQERMESPAHKANRGRKAYKERQFTSALFLTASSLTGSLTRLQGLVRILTDLLT